MRKKRTKILYPGGRNGVDRCVQRGNKKITILHSDYAQFSWAVETQMARVVYRWRRATSDIEILSDNLQWKSIGVSLGSKQDVRKFARI